MRKEVAQLLMRRAEEAGFNYSRKDRAKNHSGETFTPLKHIPLSDQTASVIYEKTSGKRAASFWIYRWDPRTQSYDWFHWMPTDSHILGMEEFGKVKKQVEKYNYTKNFE